MKYSPFITLVVYQTKEYAYNWVNDFFKLYGDAVKKVIEGDAGKVDIILHDESVISLRLPISYPLDGYKANRIHVDPQVDEKFINEILYPLCINAQIIYDENEQRGTQKT